MATTIKDALVARVGALMGGSWDTPTGDYATSIYEAMTFVAKAASTWDNEKWWWNLVLESFPTVASTASYDLRTACSDASLLSVRKMTYDDESDIDPMSDRDYWWWYRHQRPTEATAIPTHYLLTGAAPTVYLRPVPNAIYTIYVECSAEHAAITAAVADTVLIIPPAFHYDFYVQSTIWLLRTAVENVGGLESCPPFMAGIRRMRNSRPEAVDHENERDYDDFPNIDEEIRLPVANGTIPSWMG